MRSVAGSVAGSVAEKRSSTLERLPSFRAVYLGIFAFAVLYVYSVDVAELILDRHLRSQAERAIQVHPVDGPVVPQIQRNMSELVSGFWIRVGGARLNAFVFGRDGRALYLGGPVASPPPTYDPLEVWHEADRLLPASYDIVVSVPRSSLLSGGIMVTYLSVLLTSLFFYSRRLARREAERVRSAVTARDVSAVRARSIEQELQQVRRRLDEVEPTERAHAEEIRDLEKEREVLRRKLAELAERESELRTSATRTMELDQERQALEELLDEAVEDLRHKEEEIHSLQDRLKRATKAAPSGRGRANETLARRLRTLYKNLEFDDRALQDLVALGDETLRLKAEESIKRLSDESENAAIRRKVGGLPPQLSIFELGFAGKGRIYYTRGRQQRYRVLAVGAKNTQKTDLEYLSRLS